jgi:type II secretory pathway pseudopilin PulG
MSDLKNAYETAEGVTDTRAGEQGFLLVGVIVMAALVLIALSVAAPIVAKDLRREKELEAKHRGEQYVRAIRLYYQKYNSYPASVKALENTNNVRYLRQHYLDPMTGKDDWKLIGLGQAKTTVKGFFGKPLDGIGGAGLGSVGGMQSGGQANTGGTTGGTAGGAGGTTTPGATGSPGDQSGTTPGSGTGTGGFGTSSFGQNGFGQNGANGGASAFGSGTTGPFVGVGIPKEGASIITLNEQTDYSTWEFIYDPRIEQLYAKSSIFGGGVATSSGGLGSASSLSSTPGTGANGSGPGSSTTGPGTGGATSGGTTSPTTPPQ